jgi:hypothetical protein
MVGGNAEPVDLIVANLAQTDGRATRDKRAQPKSGDGIEGSRAIDSAGVRHGSCPSEEFRSKRIWSGATHLNGFQVVANSIVDRCDGNTASRGELRPAWTLARCRWNRTSKPV